MAENVAVTTLEIRGTEKVATTMKELKEQIKSYRDELVVLGQVEDKDEQQKAEQVAVIERLQKATKLLSEVTNAHKASLEGEARQVDIMNDSYNSLQAELTRLKKAYKEMTAAERESNLGSETLANIQQLDVKLKDLDAGMGQYQRNVGNYGQTFEESMSKARQNTGFLEQGMGTLMAVMGLAGTENKALITTVAGLQLALQAFNNEGVQKVIISIKEWIASKIAARSAEKAHQAEIAATTTAMTAEAAATQGATVATNGFKKALIATGIGAVVVALGALVANWEKVAKFLGLAGNAQNKVNKAMAEGAGNAAMEVAELKVLEAITTDVARAEDERSKAAEILLNRLNLTVNETTILAAKNGEYAKSITSVTAALVQQARAEAALEMIKEKQAELLEKQTDINQKAASGPNFWDTLGSVASGGAFTAGEFQGSRIERKQGRVDELGEEFDVWLQALLKNFNLSDFEFAADSGSSSSPSSSPSSSGGGSSTPSSFAGESDADIQAALAAEEAAIEQEMEMKQAMYDWELAQEEQMRQERADILHQEVVDYVNAAEQEEQIAREKDAVEKQIHEQKKQRAMETMNLTTAGLSAISSMLNAVAGAVEATSEDEEEALKKTKGLKIAGATMDMLQGVVTAIATGMQLGPIAGPIIGAINAATVLAAGAANIAQIRSTNVSGSGASPASPSVQAPTINRSLPATQILTSATDEARLDKMASDQRVKLVYSDLEVASSDQKVKVTESSF